MCWMVVCACVCFDCYLFTWAAFGFSQAAAQTKEMLSKQADQTKQILSKQANKIAKQAEEHERFITKVFGYIIMYKILFSSAFFDQGNVNNGSRTILSTVFACNLKRKFVVFKIPQLDSQCVEQFSEVLINSFVGNFLGDAFAWCSWLRRILLCFGGK